MFNKNKTVDGILKSFTKTIQDLEATASVQDNLAVELEISATGLRQAAVETEDDATSARIEGSRARTIATNLAGLLT